MTRKGCPLTRHPADGIALDKLGPGPIVGLPSFNKMESKAQRVAQPEEWLSSEPFRMLVESVNDYAIFMLDPTGHVRTWNPGAARIKGYRAEEIIGKHFSTFYPREDIEGGKCEMELAVASRTGRFEDEGWRLRKDGTRFWANVVITAIHAPDGQPAGFQQGHPGSVRAARGGRAAAPERAAAAAADREHPGLRHLHAGSDRAGDDLEPGGAEPSPSTPPRRSSENTSPPSIHRRWWNRTTPRGSWTPPRPPADSRRKGWRVRKDGSRFWAHVVIRAMRDEHQRLVGFAKVTRDLTERKNAEREQAAREAAEAGQPGQGRVPGHAGARAAQPAGPDADGAAADEAARGHPVVAGAADHRAAAEAHGPAGRRPAGRLPHHPRRLPAEQGVRSTCAT